MTEAQQQGASGPPLFGCRLYSPAAIAGYTLLTCLPVGYILHGLNLKARGLRALGWSWVGFGAASIAFALFMPPRFAPAAFIISGTGTFGAISLFQLESAPFNRALALGAVRARPWPPALFLLAALLLYLLAGFVVEAVA